MHTMPFTSFSKKVLIILFTSFALVTIAQPGGGPGGRPGMRPMGPPPGGKHDRPTNTNTSQIKPKSKITNSTTFKVVGTLLDSVTKETLPYVNVAILDSVDSTLVKGATTDMEGMFSVDGIPAGNYLMRISSIGYQNYFRHFQVSNNTALGNIYLKPGSTSLNAVTITATRPLYAMDGQKMIYNVSEDPSIQTGTTSDALQNAPGVEVDIEGNITLRGISSVEIWINDKPSKLTEENLKTYLETLPANALARIETITNPSAKYATEAEAVINIITEAHIKSNQFVSFGLNGSVQPFVSPWVSYMWAKEKLSINIYASGRYSFRDNEGNSWAVSRKDRPGAAGEYDTLTYESAEYRSANDGLGGNLFVDVSYEIDSMTDVRAYASINGNMTNNTSNYFNIRDQHWQQNGALYQYNTIDTSLSKSHFGWWGADLTKKFDNEGHNLRLSVNGYLSNSNMDEIYNRNYSDFDETHYDLDLNKHYLSDFQNNSVSLTSRYNRPYSRDGEMSYGLRFNHNNSTNLYDVSFYNEETMDYSIIDDLRAYSSHNSNNDVNGDVNWTHRWGGFTLEIGTGATYTRQSFQYENAMYPDDTTCNFFTVNPSIHTSYRTENMHNFKLNYSLRMQNPTAEKLTTFRRYGEDNYTVGNRDLTASLTHSAEAGWTKFFDRFGYLGIEAYARYSTDEIDALTDITNEMDPFLNRIISFSKPYNMGESWRYGASFNMTYRPSGFINIRLYSNIYNAGYSINYMRDGEWVDRSDSKLSWSTRLNCWVKVFNKYQIHASANYSSPTIGLLSERKARYYLNLGVRADFFKRKLSAFVNIQDLFNWGAKYGHGNLTTNPYYISSNTTKMLNSRYISAGVTLRFGKMELESKVKSGGETGDTLQ